jgi:hypothetical protein
MSNKQAMIRKLGSEEKYYEWLRINGVKGGVATSKVRQPSDYPFAKNRELAKLAGHKGKRGKNDQHPTNYFD